MNNLSEIQARMRKLTIPSVGEDVEQWELSYIANGTVKQYNYFGKQFVTLL